MSQIHPARNTFDDSAERQRVSNPKRNSVDDPTKHQERVSNPKRNSIDEHAERRKVSDPHRNSVDGPVNNRKRRSIVEENRRNSYQRTFEGNRRNSNRSGHRGDEPQPSPSLDRNKNRKEKEPPKLTAKQQKYLTWLGHTLRIVHFILNAFAWVVAVLAIVGGLIIGFSTRTLLFPFIIMDFLATTPVILLVEYGLLLAVVSSVGCFTGTGANPVMIIVYIVLAIVLLIIDLAIGVCWYFWPNALPIFMQKVKESMHGYGVDKADSVGIFALEPRVYWDHIQLRGKCCGTEEWREWLVTPIAKINDSFPYSCCNDDFRYSECGDRSLPPRFHPFNEHHGIENMVQPYGCFAKLPRPFLRSFKETGVTGVFTGATIILNILIAIVLVILILLRFYDPDLRNKYRQVSPSTKDSEFSEDNRRRASRIISDEEGPPVKTRRMK